MDPSLPPALARAHAWAHAQPWLCRFTLMNRLLLAMAFFPTGLVKATGQRFTTLPIENPIGFFFEAMFRTGPYWHFIGLAQVAAAVLLIIPTTASFGALVFLPIGISVFLITWGVGFQGTVWVTAGMLLAAIYLICWDGDRLWAAGSHLWGKRPGAATRVGMHGLEQIGWLTGGAAGMGLVLTTRGFVPNTLIPELFFLGVGGATLVVAGWVAGALGARQAARADTEVEQA